MEPTYYNLLPDIGQRLSLREYGRRNLSVTLLAIATVLLAFSALLFPTFFLAKSRIAVLETEITTEKLGSAGSSEELSKKVASVLEIVGVFGEKKLDTPSNLVGVISTKRPRGVSVTSVSVVSKGEEGRVTVSGIAADRETLLDFKRQLEESGRFAGAEIPVNFFAKGENLPFSINLSVRPAQP